MGKPQKPRQTRHKDCSFFLSSPLHTLGNGICRNNKRGELLVMGPCFLFSLLEEDSEEEEGDLCRICQIAGGSPANPLLEPCGCVGSLQFVHQECLKKWLKVKITSGRWGRETQACGGERVVAYN